MKVISCTCKAGNYSSKTCGCNSMGLTCFEFCKSRDACILNRVNENDADEEGDVYGDSE